MAIGAIDNSTGDILRPEPEVTVVVPVYEQWHLVDGLLRCLKEQTFAAQLFEVLLVDNGSSDIVIPTHVPANVRILHCSRAGSYAARNHGAGMAVGRWLAFTDADCLPSKSWLASIVEEAGRPDVESPSSALLAGPVDIIGATETPNDFEIYDMVKGIPQKRYVERGYAATANLAVKRSVFDQLGGFDADRYSGGDAEFCRRAGNLGFRLQYVAGASVQHPARATWDELATKARRVRGGQIGSGSLRHRAKWLVATALVPLRQGILIARSTNHSPARRLVAFRIMIRLWLVEVEETIRLLFGKTPERR